MANTIIPAGGVVPNADLSPIFVEGLSLSQLQSALNKNKNLLQIPATTAANRFWATPNRPVDDASREVFEITFNSARIINAVSFDVARFPHTMRVFYRSDKSSDWQAVDDTYGNQIRKDVFDSLPAVISPLPKGSTEHPQHHGSGHWIQYAFDITPVQAYQVRVVMVRQEGSVPVDRTGKRVYYSLGLRNFRVGYKVIGRDTIPPTPRSGDTITERDSFASTTDILGSPVSLSVRENRASDLLNGAIWKSEPQPIPNAVVNFYVDGRDGAGQAQTIDQFYLVPLYSGVSMNLYFSNDTLPVIDFDASDNPLSFPITRPHGGLTVISTGLDMGTDIGFVDVDNTAVQLDQTQPFWVGLTVAPHFDSTDVGTYTLLDTGSLTVRWANNRVEASYGGLTMVDDQVVFAVDQQISVVVGFDGTSLFLYTGFQGVQSQQTAGPINPAADVSSSTSGMDGVVLRFGGVLSGSPGLGNFVLMSAVAKHEPPPGIDEWDRYVLNHANYVLGAGPGSSSNNALLRYVPALQSAPDGVNPLGFVGGAPDRFDQLIWTPVSQDYRLAKGYLKLPPTKAKFWKFEFTNLAPSLYDNYQPTIRSVKLLPGTPNNTVNNGRTTYNTTTSTQQLPRTGVTGDAAVAAGASAVVQNFSDQVRLYTNITPLQPSPSYTPTSAVYSTDPTIAAKLRATTVVYNNLQPLHVINPTVVSWTPGLPHEYETVNINHTQRIAFFVGLSQIGMFRVDYTADDDTGMYLEHFLDTQHITVDSDGNLTDGWMMNETGGITAPNHLKVPETAELTSSVFHSQRKVTAIQFATQQSPAIQLIPDSDVGDAALANWVSVGDAGLNQIAQSISAAGSMIQVTRNPSTSFYGVLETTYQTYQGIEGMSYGDIEQRNSKVTPIGGVGSTAVVPISGRGRLYAAARVYAPQDLTSPLHVQIVDSYGSVLAEEISDVKAGQIAEWYVPYDLEPAASQALNSYAQVESIGTYQQVQDEGTWGSVEDNQTGYTGTVSARVCQIEPTQDRWLVDNISLFEDTLLWEFSNDMGKTWYPAYDVRNNPDGAFVFPPSSTSSAGKSLQWRVTATRPNQRVDSLAIRPRYDTLPMGQPSRDTMLSLGPNVTLSDYYAPIHQDPRWQVWSNPIPQDWWYSFRQWMLHQQVGSGTPTATSVLVSGTITGVQSGDPVRGYSVAAQAVLDSSRTDTYRDLSGQQMPIPAIDEDSVQDFYPVGRPAVQPLADGTFFAAVTMQQNLTGYSTLPNFIRIWHLAADLSILGSTDYQPDQALNPYDAAPSMVSLALDGDQVLLVMDNSYDQRLDVVWGGMDPSSIPMLGAYYRDATGTFNIVNSTSPSDPFSWFGNPPYIDQTQDTLIGLSGGLLNTGTAGMVAAKIDSQSMPVLPVGAALAQVTLQAYVQPTDPSAPTGATWRLENSPENPTLLALTGTGTLGVDVTAQPGVAGAGWYRLEPVITDPTSLAGIAAALATGDLVFSVDPGSDTSAPRRVSTMSFTASYDKQS